MGPIVDAVKLLFKESNPVNLLELPPEIRNRIYYFTFLGARISIRGFNKWTTFPTASLIVANRQIYCETIELFWKTAQFDLYEYKKSDDDLDNIYLPPAATDASNIEQNLLGKHLPHIRMNVRSVSRLKEEGRLYQIERGTQRRPCDFASKSLVKSSLADLLCHHNGCFQSITLMTTATSGASDWRKELRLDLVRFWRGRLAFSDADIIKAEVKSWPGFIKGRDIADVVRSKMDRYEPVAHIQEYPWSVTFEMPKVDFVEGGNAFT